MVESVKLPSSVPLTNILSASSSVGRLSLPLNQPILFVRFKHVVGVPSTGEGSGYSVMKLRMLDNLIDRLSKLEGSNLPQRGDKELHPRAVDALVEKLKKDLHAAIIRGSQTPYGPALGAGPSDNGMILSLSA